MKITLSKSQWQMIGKKAGWIKKAGLTPDWTGDDIKKIISSQDIGQFSKFCFWIGQGAASDANSNEVTSEQLVQRYESMAPGFAQFFNSNGAYKTTMKQGFQEGEKQLKNYQSKPAVGTIAQPQQ